MKLNVDQDELAMCVSCGLCLPHCPTFRVTGDEAWSPRGRIAAMRFLDAHDSEPDPSFVESMDSCVQCRGCETACPSAVPFGRLMEGTREALVENTNYQPWWHRVGYQVLGHHRLLLAGSRAMAVAQRAGFLPKKLGLPRLPITDRPIGKAAIGGQVTAWFFPGCVMDAWLRETHRSAVSLMELAGATVGIPKRGADCCGALHVHAGLTKQARRLAHSVMRSMPGDAPIVVDSAGCSAALKDYGHLFDTDEARAFSSRVRDIHEWLVERIDQLPPPKRRVSEPVAISDPCHLRHVQRAHEPVRTLLNLCADAIELDDEGLCCGAGGVYSVLHPATAAAIRERKMESIARSGATVVATANPGCVMHLAAGGVDARHPIDLLAWAWAEG